MRKAQLATLAGLASMLLVGFPITVLADTYVVGVEPSYPPWASVSNGQFKGIAPDAVRAMAKQQGFDVRFKSLAFSSLIPAAKAHKIDIIATALTVSKKRAKQIDFTVPWWEGIANVLVRKDSDKNIVTAMSHGARVGVQTGTTLYAWLKNNLVQKGINIHIHTYSNGPTGVSDLENGRIDAYFDDNTTAQNLIKHNANSIRLAGTIKYHPPALYALGVPKGDTKLLAILNKAEVQLYESGKWAKIVHKYLPGAAISRVPLETPSYISSYQKPIPGLGQ